MLWFARATLALLYTLENCLAKIMSLFSEKEKPIWLISERGYDAKENGLFFFKYMTSNHPEVDCYYVISDDSSDYEKVSALGKTLTTGSFEHIEKMYLADALISTHAFGYTPDMVVYSHLARLHLYHPKAKQVFLQHGILDKDAEWIYRKNFKPDMFVVSTEEEKRLVNKTCKQPENVIALTGLCRYDNLTVGEPTEKMILFMPTWRLWLQNVSEEEFVNSGYFQKINDLIHSPSLEKLLKERGYKLVFYPHIEMQKYRSSFHGMPGLVEIPDPSTVTVQELLQKCEILITDYSSVYFDVLYLKKPVLFYQWDFSDFTKKHYNGVTARYEQYGYVAEYAEVIVDYLRNYFIGKELHRDPFPFVYRDKNNCQRVYEAVLERCHNGKPYAEE